MTEEYIIELLEANGLTYEKDLTKLGDPMFCVICDRQKYETMRANPATYFAQLREKKKQGDYAEAIKMEIPYVMINFVEINNEKCLQIDHHYFYVPGYKFHLTLRKDEDFIKYLTNLIDEVKLIKGNRKYLS